MFTARITAFNRQVHGPEFVALSCIYTKTKSKPVVVAALRRHATAQYAPSATAYAANAAASGVALDYTPLSTFAAHAIAAHAAAAAAPARI